jgi:DNA mismatch repair protein MutL
MSDIIRLLPDAVANQIAAGEVIQRPASAVKELMENAIDAGATKVQLILRDAGKSLIQVVDDGNGMSDTDARLCFERHATSKIRKSDDLYTLRTMGFRGEALASIAAVAQVELKTRLVNTEIGTKIFIEGSEVKVQEPVAAPEGTSFAIKNLFYNVPARKNFLKSDPVESRHINEEFIRVALANPEIAFTMHQNGHLVYDLKKGNFKQRIAAIFGNNYSERSEKVYFERRIVSSGI